MNNTEDDKPGSLERMVRRQNVNWHKNMNELELALLQDNKGLSSYLELVSTDDFRIHINQMLEKRENQDCHALKQKLKAAIDAA